MAHIPDRIMSRVTINTENGCWEWQGYLNRGGYAFLGRFLVHRQVYREVFGDFDPSMDVCHKCDNRKCVNPEHLFIGTRRENMTDAVSKGRQAKGTRLPQTKLDEVKVLEIRRMASKGYGYRRLSRFFEVSPTCIKKVIKNETWRHCNG